jgi:hypothetical protein
MKLPFVLRSTYKTEKEYNQHQAEIIKDLKIDIENYKSKLKFLKNQHKSKIKKIEEKHAEEIQQITQQVNEVIGKLVNLERDKRDGPDLEYYTFNVEAPVKLHEIFKRNPEMLMNLLEIRIKNEFISTMEEIGEQEEAE